MADMDRAYNYYVRNKTDLLQRYRGRFIVIKDESVLGSYETHDAALEEALKSHPAGTFLIQKCDEEEQIMRFHSRVSLGGYDPVPAR